MELHSWDGCVDCALHMGLARWVSGLKSSCTLLTESCLGIK